MLLDGTFTATTNALDLLYIQPIEIILNGEAKLITPASLSIM